MEQGKEMEQQGSGYLGLSYEHQALPEMEAVWYRLEDPTLGVDTPLGTFPPPDCRWTIALDVALREAREAALVNVGNCEEGKDICNGEAGEAR